MKRRIFIDMDGVLADFDGLKQQLGVTGEQLKLMHGIFERLQPMPGAVEAIDKLRIAGYDIYIASRPSSRRPESYTEKARWIQKYLPLWSRRLILTHDKSLLGDEYDILIDDHPERSNCMDFKGRVMHFGKHPFTDWEVILRHLLP